MDSKEGPILSFLEFTIKILCNNLKAVDSPPLEIFKKNPVWLIIFNQKNWKLIIQLAGKNTFLYK